MRIKLWEKFKAWRRGEILVPGISRGRCFIKKPISNTPSSSGSAMPSKAEPKIELVGIKVIRADGSTEDIQ